MSRFAGACQFVAAATVALAAAGCGGSGSTTTNPPPTNTTPASVVVQAGDGQLAAPGAAVATSPAVLVTNSAGQPLAGVTVTFSVDSGGGSLSTASATTGANGIATAGTWTLGSSEGRNTLRVTVGSLSPIKIAATAVITATSYPPVTLGTGGGPITVTQPGPLNGFSITVPAGAFSSGITATVSYASNAALPRTTIIPVSPLITISTTTTDFSTLPLTIHIPATIPPGDFPVIVVYDQATGTREVLTTTAWDANGVTAITNSLSGARILGTGSLRSNSLFAFLQGPGAVLVAEALPPDVLNADYDSGYRPGVDDWEFSATMTEITRTTGQLNTIGVPGTSLWYYAAHPSPTRLNGRFLMQSGVPYSDRLGMRWTATLGYEFDVNAVNSVIKVLSSRAASVAAFDANQARTIRTRFAIAAQDGGRARPVLVGGLSQDEVPVFLIVYRVTGNQFYVADPYSPGDLTRFLEFTPGNPMTPYVTGPNRGTTLSEPLALGLNSLIPLDRFAATYAQVLDGTIGQDRFPSYELHGWVGRLYDTLFIVDSLRWWVECPQCTNAYATTLSPPPGGNLAAQAVYDNNASSGTFFFTKGAFATTATAPAAGADRPLASLIVSADAPQASDHTGFWLDWHKYVLRRLQTSISPASPAQLPGTPLSLTFQVAQNLLPPSVKYIWDFGDQQPAVPVTVTDNPVVQHSYATTGTFPVTAKIVDVRNNQVIGVATSTVTVQAPPIWRFTSIALTSETGPAPGAATNPVYNSVNDSLNLVKTNMAKLIAIPSDGLLLYIGLDYKTILNLPPATFAFDDVIDVQIATVAGSGASITRPVLSGIVTYELGHCGAGGACTTASTTFITSTGSPLTGSLTGMGLWSNWPFFTTVDQNGPLWLRKWSWWELSATKNGTTLTGTIRYNQQMANATSDAFIGTHVVTWTFTATMVP